MSDYYVYIYYESEDSSVPLYVGKGHGNRFRDHLKSYYLRLNTRWAKKLKSLIDAGFEPKAEIVGDSLTETEAFALERHLIRQFGRKDLESGSLYNSTDGGDGIRGHLGHRMSDENRRKVGERSKGNTYLRGYKPSAETRAKNSEANKGRQFTKGKIFPNRRRPVRQLDWVGNLIREYGALYEVAIKGFSPTSVSRCLSGKQKYAHGYQWEAI